jgi:hypothetical protein
MKKSPSRERYEKSNPTVSARLPVATRDKLLADLKTLHKSMSEAFKALAGEIEVTAGPLEVAWQEGFDEAKKRYAIMFPCSQCGRPVAITSPKTKAQVARYIAESGGKHFQCPQ